MESLPLGLIGPSSISLIHFLDIIANLIYSMLPATQLCTQKCSIGHFLAEINYILEAYCSDKQDNHKLLKSGTANYITNKYKIFKGIVHPKIKISHYYSPSCRSKLVRPPFIFGTQIKIFLMQSESFPTLHGQQQN